VREFRRKQPLISVAWELWEVWACLEFQGKPPAVP